MARSKLTRLAVAAASMLISVQAHAAVTVNIVESGGNVVADATGSLNLTGLNFIDFYSFGPGVSGVSGFVGVGSAGTVQGFSGLTGPVSFSAGGYTAGTNPVGPSFGIEGNTYLGSPIVFVPTGYVTGSAFSSQTSFLGASLSSLGLTPGQYISTSSNDSITVNIFSTNAVPEPATWAMMLLGFGGIGFAMRRRKYAPPQVA